MSTVRRWACFAAALIVTALITAGCSGADNDSRSTGEISNSAKAGITSEKSKANATVSAAKSSQVAAPTQPFGSKVTPESPNPAGTANGHLPVSGQILDKYNSLGGAHGVLGAPTGPQQPTPGDGTYQDFTGGTIYRSDSTGAHAVLGAIRTAYQDAGGPGGKLGFPTSDETDTDSGKKSTFQHGTITWNSSDGKTQVSES
ncbi:LGFP repeat-containing protein [Skermania sp. ID1734]|uniref:LGFP repeat-containing protein n=1 Tax=Skermania sp. ID1734 TaxID=2597516 RepID=UPI00163D43F8|nr:esterase [Skermania sp. ID1734]